MSIRGYFHKADIVIVVLIAAAIAYFLYRHFKPEKENKVTPVG
jgi:hypothetical protein